MCRADSCVGMMGVKQQMSRYTVWRREEGVRKQFTLNGLEEGGRGRFRA